MMPSQKFGVEMPNSAMPLATQSTGRSRRTAERTPAGTPISTAIRKAMTASWKVTGSFARISCATGSRMRQEKPKSPCTTAADPAQVLLRQRPVEEQLGADLRQHHRVAALLAGQDHAPDRPA